MKRSLSVLLLVVFALPACSAEDATGPAQTDSAETAANIATAGPAAAADPIALAQADQASPAAATPAAAPRPAVAAPDARADIVEGRHYRVLRPAQRTSSSPDKVEVAEMFMYSCPHCFTLEPFIDNYREQKPPYVNVVRVPASFNAMARVHTKAFYVAETLGVLDELHLPFFKALHVERKRLSSEAAITDFFVANGVQRADVEEALNSFAIDTKMRRADSLVRSYRIDSVPTLVVNGKYVTSGSMAGSIEKLRDVLDYLVALEAAEL